MRRRILPFVLSLLLILSITPLVSATAKYDEEQTDTSIAAVYNSSGTLQGYIDSIEDIQEIVNADYRILLLKDLSVTMQNSRITSTGLMVSCNLELNGHTITVTGEATSGEYTTAIAGIIVTGDISGGTVDLQFKITSGSSSVMPKATCGILAASSSTISNLEIVYSGEEGESETKIDGLSYGSYTGSSPEIERKNTVKNVVIDVPGTAVSKMDISTPKSTLNIESGSFTNFPIDAATNGITTPQNPLTVQGTAENVTVYTSDSTTAIIVQDGNAYLYDTLQEAVDAAAKRATTGTDDKKKAEILVLKTPDSKDPVNLPEELEGIQVSVTPLTNPGDVSLNDVQFKGTDGKTYVIGENGILTEVTEEPDPVPPPVVVPSEPTYRPTITQTENGTVSTSPSYPEKDDKVTITATPEEGYKVGTVTVVDKNGNPVQVSSEGNGKYSYQQPEGSVTITVDFVWDNPFSDVKEGAWYYEAVQYVQLHGLMEGLPGNVFGPNKELTRAEVVQILYNLEGKPAVTGESTFTDVNGHWAVAPITWADQNKVIGGYGDGTFLPDKPVSREEFAQMMYNYTIFKKLDASATADLTKFPDGTDVANWAETAMEWANGNELINGHEDGTLDPQGTANRAQAASILMRFDQNLVIG